MTPKFYQCSVCGKIIALVQDSGTKTVCCGKDMFPLLPNTVDAAKEKHVPVVTVSGQSVKIVVGAVAHPMLAVHHIAWIALETTQGMQRKELPLDGEPVATFALVKGEKPVAAYAYCNLHGLWKADIK